MKLAAIMLFAVAVASLYTYNMRKNWPKPITGPVFEIVMLDSLAHEMIEKVIIERGPVGGPYLTFEGSKKNHNWIYREVREK